MKLKTIALYLCLFLPILTLAQKKQRVQKPILLVFGSDIEALAVAIQSAKSSVPTLWVTDVDQIAEALTTSNISITSNNFLDGGLWMELLMSMSDQKSKSDSVAITQKQNISPFEAETTIEKLISTIPLLTIERKAGIKNIAWRKRGWEVTLSDKKRYMMRTIVDASKTQTLKKYEPTEINTSISTLTDLSLEAARTIVGIAESDNKIYALTRNNLVKDVKNNFFKLSILDQFDPSVNNIPLRIQFSQALGATAAYTAFFKSTPDKIDTRKLQTELMTYGGRLAPISPIEDQYFTVYQKIFLTGIFDHKTANVNDTMSVSFAEISPVLNQLYSRSQLWFLDNKGEYLTRKEAISLVKFVGLRGDEVDRQIEKDWSKLKFEGDFNLDKQISKKEFSVILDRFASPYTISINAEGKIIR